MEPGAGIRRRQERCLPGRLYGATQYGPAYLAAAFAFANHWMSTDRIAFANDHLTADFNAQSYGGRLEGGYRFATAYGGITPYAAIQAQSFHTPGYSETDTNGGGFALAFNSRTGTATRSELGTRFDRVLALYTNAVLSLRGRLAWAHDWVSDPRSRLCSRRFRARASSSTARRRRRIPHSPRPARSFASPTASRCSPSSMANLPRTLPHTPAQGPSDTGGSLFGEANSRFFSTPLQVCSGSILLKKDFERVSEQH